MSSFINLLYYDFVYQQTRLQPSFIEYSRDHMPNKKMLELLSAKSLTKNFYYTFTFIYIHLFVSKDYKSIFTFYTLKHLHDKSSIVHGV